MKAGFFRSLILIGIYLFGFQSTTWAADSDFAGLFHSVTSKDSAQEVNSATIQSLSTLETQLTTALADSSDPQKVESIAQQLATKYIRVGYIQEAIWTLRRGRKVSSAVELERVLENYLHTANPQSTDLLLNDYIRVLRFSGNIRVVFRVLGPAAEQPIEAEPRAYTIDKALSLDVVPMTILREFEGTRGSMQYFVQYTELGDKSFKSSPQNYKNKQFQSFYILDYLIQNVDRHKKNWLRRIGGQLVSIDHGVSFDGTKDPFFKQFVETLKSENRVTHEAIDVDALPERELAERILKLSPKTLADRLNPTTDAEVKAFIVSRLEQLKTAIRSSRTKSCHGIFFNESLVGSHL